MVCSETSLAAPRAGRLCSENGTTAERRLRSNGPLDFSGHALQRPRNSAPRSLSVIFRNPKKETKAISCGFRRSRPRSEQSDAGAVTSVPLVCLDLLGLPASGREHRQTSVGDLGRSFFPRL